MGTGFLKIQTTTADETLPVANAKVVVTNAKGVTIHEAITDANGFSPSFSIEAPDASLTLDPTNTLPPFSTVDVTVSATGFITKNIQAVVIVDTQEATLPVTLHPLARGRSTATEEYLEIPPIGLLQPQAPKEGPDENPRSRSNTPTLNDVFIPDYITVHLGAPSADARNVRVRFIDYIKNVTSSEIYSTWPRESLLANIHAIVTYALNRIYTEWYRSRGYPFDITSVVQFDQCYRDGGPIYTSISNLVDEFFNAYLHRQNFKNPFFSSFCAGASGTCQHGGMSQWGTVSQANQGKTALQILQNSYGNDIVLSTATTAGITSSFPGTNLTAGNSGPNVQRMQNFLNRIRVNFPAIPRIENPNGVFGADTAAAVRAFQQAFNLPQTGIINLETWNRITQVYVSVTNLASLNSEGTRIDIGTTPPTAVIFQGSRGQHVLELQFILNTIAAFYPEIPTVIKDGVFDARTRNSVVEFQKRFNLPADGIVNEAVWRQLYSVYHGLTQNIPAPPPQAGNTPPYPGTLLRLGSQNENVRLLQKHLNIIRTRYPQIPQLTEDGSFGPTTQRAVIAFQQERQLTPDGIVGSTTWNEIMEVYRMVLGDVPPVTAPPPTPPSIDCTNYVVAAGDSLWTISQKFKTSVEAIVARNSLPTANLSIGQKLCIPTNSAPTPTPPPPQPPTPPSSCTNYTVTAGDSLWLIAQKFKTSVEAIISRNSLPNANLSIGQKLCIPTTSSTNPPSNSGSFPIILEASTEQPAPQPPTASHREYVVEYGDSLWLIAQKYGSSVEAIKATNRLTNDLLQVGQMLIIPS